MQHTKGPWYWKIEGDKSIGWKEVNLSNNHKEITIKGWLYGYLDQEVIVYAGCGSHYSEILVSDARLISSSPNLFEALNSIISLVHTKNKKPCCDCGDIKVIAEKAIESINGGA